MHYYTKQLLIQFTNSCTQLIHTHSLSLSLSFFPVCTEGLSQENGMEGSGECVCSVSVCAVCAREFGAIRLCLPSMVAVKNSKALHCEPGQAF